MDIQLIESRQLNLTNLVPVVGRIGGTGFLSVAVQQEVAANKSEEKTDLTGYPSTGWFFAVCTVKIDIKKAWKITNYVHLGRKLKFWWGKVIRERKYFFTQQGLSSTMIRWPMVDDSSKARANHKKHKIKTIFLLVIYRVLQNFSWIQIYTSKK